MWLIGAIAAQPWCVERWAGRAPLPKAQLLLWGASGVLVLFAALTWFGAGRSSIARLNLLAASLVVLGIPLAEVALRASFLIEGSPTRAPIRFSHNLLDDDYWVLMGRWTDPEERIAPARIHAGLGWSQTDVTQENPLGLFPETRGLLKRDGRPKVLFYGDSYVAGQSRPENWIPAYLDARLPGTDVVNLGVGGYGTGQAYLLYGATRELVERPLVIMSSMVYDFDRAILSVRSYQKPRLRVHDSGTIVVTNTPVDEDPDRFFRDAPLSFQSFVLKALERRYLPLEDPLFPEKRALNRAILEATADLAASDGSDLLYVLFHPAKELAEQDFRSQFFLESLADLGIECFDTRGPLLDHVADSAVGIGKMYVNGHHNDLGNQVIGEALLVRLRELGFE